MDKIFVSTGWLADHLHDPQVVILDSSWHLPSAGRDAHAEYLASHIPGALFFDIDAIADKNTSLPHMLPTPADFARMVGAMGIGDGMTVVIYDELGFLTAPRCWWELTTMGAKDVRVLFGGGPKWRAEDRPLQSGDTKRAPAVFTPDFHPQQVRDFATVRALVEEAGSQIADARPAGRFAGQDAEPRPGLRAGHMPGSINIPVATLHTGGVIKSRQELRTIFEAAGLDLTRPIVTTCGSGVTASALALALQVAGAKEVAVYDGSWAEWGAHPDAPVEAG